jgi:hypothetical protein
MIWQKSEVKVGVDSQPWTRTNNGKLQVREEKPPVEILRIIPSALVRLEEKAAVDNPS